MSISCVDALDLDPPKAVKVPVVLVAAAALFDSDGRVLVAQRPEGKSMAGLWEFPGGKVEEGETPEFCLMRELEEELGIETRPCCFSPVAFASHTYDDFHLLMPLFACYVWKGSVSAKEHKSLKWVFPDQLYELDMPAADLPLIDSLQRKSAA